ncbi:MAG: AEC family transporter [Thermoproteales archaeon]|nr:AEC family transporter [Thermoproteales archaeon]
MSSILEPIILFYLPLALGYIFKKYGKASERFSKDFSRLILYIFLPALLFDSIYTKSLGGEFGELLTLTLVGTASVFYFLAVSKLFFKNRFELSMTLFYANSGYLPIPLAISFWGVEAVPLIGFYIIGNNLTSNILIPLLSARDLKGGLERLKNFPPIYAALLGLILAVAKIEIPGIVLKAASTIGDLAPTLALIVLGVDIASSGSFDLDGVKVYLIRQVFSIFLPFLAFIIGLRDLAFYIVILEALMPPAVSNIILAQEYDIKPEKVARVVLTATILATLVTIPFLIFLFSV